MFYVFVSFLETMFLWWQRFQDFFCILHSQRRIQDFPGGRQPQNVGRQPIIQTKFPEDCMKIKKIGPKWWGRVHYFTM